MRTEIKLKNNWLSDYKRKYASQRGEDGILEKIFEVLGTSQGWYVDVGAQGLDHSNTYNLFKKGWSGILIDADETCFQDLLKTYQGSKAFCMHERVEPTGEKSLDNLLAKTRLPAGFDLLDIDIDGNDYYVWESLIKYIPTVVLIEFNPIIKLDDYRQPVNGQGGSSLSVLTKLGKTKGYELVATTTINAFFVKRNLFDKFKIKDNSVAELFTNSNDSYGRDRTNYTND